MCYKNSDLYSEGLEEFPLATVIIENLFMFLWIFTGAFICWSYIPIAGWSYLAFGLVMVLFVMRIMVCKNCYYHGKLCHTGWGKLSALYCKKGEIKHFGCGFTGVMIPIFYGSMALLPIVLGILSLINEISLFKIALLIVFIFIVIMSSFTLRKVACKSCKMKNICPGTAAK